MRRLWTAVVIGPVVWLAACQTGRVDPGATLPTVSFAYNDKSEYAEVLGEADRFCDSEFAGDAVLLRRDPADGFTEAVFACR